MEGKKCVYSVWGRKNLEERDKFENNRHSWEDDIKIDLKLNWGVAGWIMWLRVEAFRRAIVNTVINLPVP